MYIHGRHYLDSPSDRVPKPVQLKHSFIRMHGQLIVSYHTKVNDVDSSCNVMAQGDAWEGKWRGNWWMEWVASTPHTTSEHGVSSITTADSHTSAACIRLNWGPRWFKWTRPFRRTKKSGFCACAITFQLASTIRTSKCSWWKKCSGVPK